MTLVILFGYKLEDAVKVTLQMIQLAYIGHPQIITVIYCLHHVSQMVVCLEQV
jgi:hypothetical protein